MALEAKSEHVDEENDYEHGGSKDWLKKQKDVVLVAQSLALWFITRASFFSYQGYRGCTVGQALPVSFRRRALHSAK